MMPMSCPGTPAASRLASSCITSAASPAAAQPAQQQCVYHTATSLRTSQHDRRYRNASCPTHIHTHTCVDNAAASSLGVLNSRRWPDAACVQEGQLD
jgi:hypothetical protein